MSDENELLDLVIQPGHLRFMSAKLLVTSILWHHKIPQIDPDEARDELFRREWLDD